MEASGGQRQNGGRGGGSWNRKQGPHDRNWGSRHSNGNRYQGNGFSGRGRHLGRGGPDYGMLPHHGNHYGGSQPEQWMQPPIGYDGYYSQGQQPYAGPQGWHMHPGTAPQGPVWDSYGQQHAYQQFQGYQQGPEMQGFPPHPPQAPEQLQEVSDAMVMASPPPPPPADAEAPSGADSQPPIPGGDVSGSSERDISAPGTTTSRDAEGSQEQRLGSAENPAEPKPGLPISFGFQKKPVGKLQKNPGIFKGLVRPKPPPALAPAPLPAAKHQEAGAIPSAVGDKAGAPLRVSEAKKERTSRWGRELLASQIASPADPTSPENPASPPSDQANLAAAPDTSQPKQRPEERKAASSPAARGPSPNSKKYRRSRSSSRSSSRSYSSWESSRSRSRSRSSRSRSSSLPRRVFSPPPAPKREVDPHRLVASPIRDRYYDRPLLDRRRLPDRDRCRRSPPPRDRYRSRYDYRSPSYSPRGYRHRDHRDYRDSYRDRHRRSPSWERPPAASRGDRHRHISPAVDRRREEKRPSRSRLSSPGPRKPRPNPDDSPEEGEVPTTPPPKPSPSPEAVDMDLEEQPGEPGKKGGSSTRKETPLLASEKATESQEDAEAAKDDKDEKLKNPPVPGPARVKLDQEVEAFESETLARLKSVFAKHGLDLGAAPDVPSRSKLAAEVADRVTFATSDRLILTFDSDPADERSESSDDLSCLGDPSIWGFPSWLPPPLASLENAPPVPEASPWRTLDEGLVVPWFAEGVPPVDPRGKPEAAEEGSQLQPQLIPLPPFAFAAPQIKEKPTTSGCSWSQTPQRDLQDDANTKGVVLPGHLQRQPPLLQGGVPPLVPKMNQLPQPGMHFQLRPAGAPGITFPQPHQQGYVAAAHFPRPGVPPPPQDLPKMPAREEPEKSNDWSWIGRKGVLSSRTTSLDRLRHYVEDGGRDGMTNHACAYRAADNLWLPVELERQVRLKDLEWGGKVQAQQRLEADKELPEGSAKLSDSSILAWFNSVEIPNGNLQPAAKRRKCSHPPEDLAASEGAPTDADVVAWGESLHAANLNLLRSTMYSITQNRRMPQGPPGKRAQGIWGPPPPLHIPAMLKGRLALRVLGGKEGETIAANIIEKAFASVMKKEPERQARLKAEREQQKAEEEKQRAEQDRRRKAEFEEAERQNRQAELRRKAEEHKQKEDHRKRLKAAAAKEERRRAEERLQAQRQKELDLQMGREREEREQARLSSERERQRSAARPDPQPLTKAAREESKRRLTQLAESHHLDRPGSRWDCEARPAPRGQVERIQDFESGHKIDSCNPVALGAQPAGVEPEQDREPTAEEPPPPPPPPDSPVHRFGEASSPPRALPLEPPDLHRGGSRRRGQSPADEWLPSQSESSPERRPVLQRSGSAVKGRPARKPRDDESEDSEYIPGSQPRNHGPKRRRVPEGSTPRKRARQPARSRSADLPAEREEPLQTLETPRPSGALHRVADPGGMADSKRQEIQAALLKRLIPGAIRELWSNLRKFDREKLDALFAEPVDRKEFPDYDTIIETPMDFKTLGKLLRRFPETMEGLEALKAHVLQISDNAEKYAEVLVDAGLRSAAQELRQELEKLFRQKVKEIESESYF